ncbi:MAG: sulfatase-like hydrolase/transferase [bacterium]|nr:sulfatase-like hydrolase/transferase [bacterium]
MAQDRPNILFIMDDQHRWDYLGSMGADFIRTPHLDRLAERGIQFTSCTTNCPVCAPSRVALASGLQPTRVGALDNSCFLPQGTTSYYQRLRDHGYYVGCSGKLDLAKPIPYNGRNGDRPSTYMWGFTHPIEIEGKMHAGGSKVPQGPYNYFLHEKGLLEPFVDDYTRRSQEGYYRSCHDSVLPTEGFADTYIGQRAVEWIDTIPDDFPWHMFVSFVGPHDPFDPPTEYADKYRGAEMPPPISADLTGKPRYLEGRIKTNDMTDEEVLETRRQYCAATELIDDQVGAILDAVERRGMSDNTYVIFASDHGEMLGDHGCYTKSVPYESALRVPLIVAGPGIEGGRKNDGPVELIDVNPTICELAGLSAQANIDAQSFNPVLQGETDQHRTEAVSAIRNFRLIRTSRYKLIENYNDLTELYDLEEDPEELNNIAGENRDLVRELSRRLSQRYQEGAWMRG